MEEAVGLSCPNGHDCYERVHVAAFGTADYQASLLLFENRIGIAASDIAWAESCDGRVTFSEAELSDGMRTGRRSLKRSRYVGDVNTRNVCRSGKGSDRESAEPHCFC